MELMSPQVNELATALAKAQSQIKKAHKDKTNPFFKSAYSTLESVWLACEEALHSNGLSVAQMTHISEQGPSLVTTLLHSSGQWIRGEYLLTPVKTDPQALGSALSYAKRYALAAMVGVVSSDEDDDGEKSMNRQTNQGVPNEPTRPTQRPVTSGTQTHGPATGVYQQSVTESGIFSEADEFRSFNALPAQAQTQGSSSGSKEQIDGSLTLKMKGFNEPVSFSDAWTKHKDRAISLAVFFKANDAKGEKVAGKLRQFVNYGHAHGFVDFGL